MEGPSKPLRGASLKRGDSRTSARPYAVGVSSDDALDGRHLDEGEAVGGDGADPREGEPHDGGAPGGLLPGARDQGLAASVPVARAARLRVSGAAAGGVRRRLLLARLSAACHLAEEQRAVLAGDDRAQ